MTINNIASMWVGGLPTLTFATGKRAGSGLFTDALQNAAQENSDEISCALRDQGITEDGRNSTGTNALTDAQKQYLIDKYHLTDPSQISQSDFDSILKELTNMGVLSYQDYQQAHLMPLIVDSNGMGAITTRDLSQDWLSDSDAATNAFGYYQQLDQEELEQIQYGEKHWGLDLSDPANSRIKENLDAHLRIEDLVKSLFQ